MDLSLIHLGGLAEWALPALEFGAIGLAAWLCHKLWGL